MTAGVTLPLPPDLAAGLLARAEAAERQVAEALALARQAVSQLDQAYQARADAVAQVATLRASIEALQDVVAHEREAAAGERAARVAAETRAAGLAGELAAGKGRWPIAEALRDFWNRRGRP